MQSVCIRTQLQTGLYRMPAEDILRLDRESIYIVPDTNIFLHKPDAIDDLLLRGNNQNLFKESSTNNIKMKYFLLCNSR